MRGLLGLISDRTLLLAWIWWRTSRTLVGLWLGFWIWSSFGSGWSSGNVSPSAQGLLLGSNSAFWRRTSRTWSGFGWAFGFDLPLAAVDLPVTFLQVRRGFFLDQTVLSDEELQELCSIFKVDGRILNLKADDGAWEADAGSWEDERIWALLSSFFFSSFFFLLEVGSWEADAGSWEDERIWALLSSFFFFLLFSSSFFLLLIFWWMKCLYL